LKRVMMLRLRDWNIWAKWTEFRMSGIEIVGLCHIIFGKSWKTAQIFEERFGQLWIEVEIRLLDWILKWKGAVMLNVLWMFARWVKGRHSWILWLSVRNQLYLWLETIDWQTNVAKWLR
jgi:hypothetical protein